MSGARRLPLGLRRRIGLSVAAVALALPAAALAQGAASYRATWNYNKVKDRHQFSLKFDEYAVTAADEPLVAGDFKLWAVGGDESRRQVPFQLIAEPLRPSDELDSSMVGTGAGQVPAESHVYLQAQFVPDFLPEEGETFEVEILRAPLGIAKGTTLSEITPSDAVVANPDDLKLNKGYVRPMPEKPHFSISAGDEQGVAAFKAKYSLGKLSGKSWLHMDLDFRGDFSLQSDTRDEYFDSVSGEFRAFGVGRQSFLGSEERYVQWGAHYRLESDAAFDNSDHNLGLDFATYTKDPISAGLAGLFVPGDQAVVTPLLRLEANYVAEASAKAANKPDTSDGVCRASANLDWHLPLGRDLEWDFLPAIGAISDLDLLLEGRATYDFDTDEFLDQSKVILRFSRAGENESRVSFDVTFASGESAPLYEQINALLFGLNMDV